MACCIFDTGGGIVCFGLAPPPAAAVLVVVGADGAEGGGTPHATVPPRFGLILVGAAMGFKLAASGEVIVLG